MTNRTDVVESTDAMESDVSALVMLPTAVKRRSGSVNAPDPSLLVQKNGVDKLTSLPSSPRRGTECEVKVLRPRKISQRRTHVTAVKVVAEDADGDRVGVDWHDEWSDESDWEVEANVVVRKVSFLPPPLPKKVGAVPDFLGSHNFEI